MLIKNKFAVTLKKKLFQVQNEYFQGNYEDFYAGQKYASLSNEKLIIPISGHLVSDKSIL